GPPTAVLSAGRAPGAADKSKPPPLRRENQGIRAASLDHLNDPLSRGFSADSGGMSSLATGLWPIAADVFGALHSPLHARGVADHRFWISAGSCRRPPWVGHTR